MEMNMNLPKKLIDYSALLGFPGSRTMERILAILFENDDEKKIAEALPGTLEDIIEKTGFPKNQAEGVLDGLLMKGAIGKKLNDDGKFRLFPAMIELRDSTVLYPEAPQELFELWEDIITKEFEPLIPIAKAMKVEPVTRVLPVEQSIKSKNMVLDVDSARKIFQDADLITVLPCACRLQLDKIGKRNADCPAPADSVCMQTNRFAEAVLRRGIGKKIDREDALRRLEAAEEAGLVHMVRNNVKEDMFMCNCCSCCCVGLHNIIHQYGYLEGIAKSRFTLQIIEEDCTACGLCADRCQFTAIEIQEAATVDEERCFGCGNCVGTCPVGALSLVEVRPVEHIRVK